MSYPKRKAPPPTRLPHSSPRRAGSSARDEGGPRFISRGVRIVHEDDELLIVDKPAGIITADPAAASGRPAAKAGSTLFDILKKHVKAQPDRRATRTHEGERERATGPRLWIIHRLDKEASGLLIFAKSERAFAWLKEDLRAKRIDRIYSAACEGIIGRPGDTGIMQSFIREETPRHVRAHGKKGRPGDDDDQGKLAVTHYRVVAAASNRTLVEVKLDTGRKNQIRIHFAEKGFPLVGDRRFGAKTDAIGRLALHAAELTFTPPGGGNPMTFRSPAPPAFYRCVGLTPPEVETPPMPAPKPAAPVPSKKPAAPTSWDEVAGWYDQLLEGERNDHYDDVVVPGALRLLAPQPGTRVLDVASGQGILARKLAAQGVGVVGVEASPALVNAARQRSKDPPAGAASLRFEVGDARELGALGLEPGSFDSAACVMALSNIDPIDPVFRGVAKMLKPGGTLVWIITHPSFRAAGQTAWGWDEQDKKQYRRVDGYLSAGQKKIEMNPGKAARGQETAVTWTFHRPLQTYVDAMSQHGLLIERLEEWPSLRASTSGPRASEENRARREIPLFLGVRAVKVAQAQPPK